MEVLDASVQREGGAKVTGTVKNLTGHVIHTTGIVLSLIDQAGSMLGAVRVQVDDLAPNASVKFQVPIEQPDAVLTLVREVQTQ